MNKELSALKVKEPEFYFRNDSPYWISRVKWEENINKEIALVGEDRGDRKVFGIIELREPTRIKDIEDIFENISRDAYKNFKTAQKDIWAYPVVIKKDFSNRPRIVKDGLEDGQRNWIKEVSFFRQRKEHYSQLDLSTLQSYHDRIHNYYDSDDPDFRLVNHHYFIADEFNERNVSHPMLDGLDINYIKMSLSGSDNEFESFEDGVNSIKETYSDEKAMMAGYSYLSEKFNDGNPLIDNLGNWSAEHIMKWEPSLSEEEAELASKYANELILKMAEKGLNLKTAIQRALSIAIPKARKDNE